jgi:surface polysaccharide O-acyltransferase-like enzyme
MKNALKTNPAHQPVAKTATKANQAMHTTDRNKLYFLLALSLIGIVAVFFTDPIPQDHAYHNFADARKLFSIPNFWNVLSNLPFLIIGAAGFYSIASKKPQGIFPQLTAAYLLFYTGIFFTGIGSAYYHLNPENSTLLWDRLPMTITFMAFFAIIIGEFIGLETGRKILLPLLFVGAISVLYWHLSEMTGKGDLRLYALVQFLPIILIPVIMLLFKAKTDTTFFTWLVVIAYLIAKAFEIFDEQFLEITHQVSGHTLKHVVAALAPLIFLIGLYKRGLKTR